MTCTFTGCDKPAWSKGLCSGHYQQQYKGKPLTPLNPRLNGSLSAEERLWLMTTKTEGCWLFGGRQDDAGHCVISVDGVQIGAHVYSFLLHGGVVPDGLQVNHHCDVGCCVRPDHLYAGTQQDNVDDMNRRGRNHFANKTHCKHGHEYTEENTRVTSHGTRVCRKCRARWSHERYYARKDGAA